MKATEQTLQQLERALRKVMEKFPENEEAAQLTDVHIRVTQDTGELMVFDDDDNEFATLANQQAKESNRAHVHSEALFADIGERRPRTYRRTVRGR